MSSGLPNSGKSKAVQKLFDLQSKPQPGFSHYESIATGLSPSSKIEAGRVNDNSLHYYGFLCGLKRNLLVRTKDAEDFINDYTQEVFNDEVLKTHLHNILECLKDTYNPTIEAKTAKRGLKQIKGLMKGAGLIKVWDLSFNSMAYQFIRCFSGHLYNSYMWLFTDIERDRLKLHKPPTEVNAKMRRSRLEYLVSSSKMSSNIKTKRKNACTIFATYEGKEQPSVTITKLQKECLNAAPQLGVQDLINEEVIPINFDETDQFFLLAQLKQQITRDPNEIPLSYIFLRGALDLLVEQSIFIRRSQLILKARECNIDDEEGFVKFCKYFTSFGSILDISFINSMCDIIIIKPDKFLTTLDEVFNKQDKGNLLTDGIITQDLAPKLFGKESNMYLEVLEAVGLITNVTHHSPSDYAHYDFCYYMPSFRKSEDNSRYNPFAIQLVRSVRYPSINMEVALSKNILDKLPNGILQPSNKDNMTQLHFIQDDLDTTITIVYQGGVIEFLVKSSDMAAIPLYVETIIDVCKVIAEDCNFKRYGKPQYHFAVLCAEDKNESAYNFSRQRHILPDDEPCRACVHKKHHNEHTMAWINALIKVSQPITYYIYFQFPFITVETYS